MGRSPSIVNKTFSDINGNIINKKVELFSWEKLDFIELLKNLKFNMKEKYIPYKVKDLSLSDWEEK